MFKKREIQVIDGDQIDDFPLWEVHIKKKKKNSLVALKHEPQIKNRPDIGL